MPGFPAGRGELRIVALIGRQQHVAIVAPHRPEPAEPAVVHRHAADIAELDLAVRLQLLARGDEFCQRLRHFLRLHEVGAVEEHAEGLSHRHDRVLALRVGEHHRRHAPFVGKFVGRDVVRRLQQMRPGLPPIVIVPDHVVLIRVRGQRCRHLLDIDAVGIRHLDDLDAVLGAPGLEHRDRSVLDRARLVADPQLLHLCGGTAGRSHQGRGRRHEPSRQSLHSLSSCFLSLCRVLVFPCLDS